MHRRTIGILTASAFSLFAACGDAPAIGKSDGSTSATVSAAPTSSVPPTTTLMSSSTTTSELDNGELEERLEAAGSVLGLDIPGGAWADWGFALCEGPTDTNMLMTAAEDLVVLYQGDGPASAEDTLLAAEILWRNTQILCPGSLTDEQLSAGPPAEYQFPRCEVPPLSALPWSEDVGEPSEESVADGVVEASWSGPVYYTSPAGDEVRQEMGVLVGRGETFRRLVDAGESPDEIRGDAAFVMEYNDTATSSIEVGWATTDRWCDAVVVRLNPDPLSTPVSGSEATNLVDYVESLMFSLFVPSLNQAESIIVPAVQSVEGARSLGGEPSHGGLDAVMAFEIDDQDYWVYAVPNEIGSERFELGEPIDEAIVEDVDVVVYETEGMLAAVFERAGLTIRVDAPTAGRSALLDAVARLVRSIDRVAEQP